VHWTLELGYRHVVTTQRYGIEESVGKDFRQSGLHRHEAFVTTNYSRAFKLRSKSLNCLQRLRLDQMNIHLFIELKTDPRGCGPAQSGAGPGVSAMCARSVGRTSR
jgi:diketogulonate reductase-like aldo/keto reductase